MENSLSIVEDPKAHGKSYGQWLGDQAKLQAGKDVGYAQWEKVFNLKQMAKTLNYLTEHGLLEYAALEEQTEAATVQYRQLSDQLKATEKRMADLSAMRT